MRQIRPDLWETEAERPLPGLITHAYLLTREGGNLLFYNTSHVQEIEAMAELGGVARQFLSHRDELGPSLETIRERFGAELGGHRAEAEDFARFRAPDIFFDRREVLPGDVEVIPAPGHTPGSTCFLVLTAGEDGAGKRTLFTGDTLFLRDDGSWQAGYIEGMSAREPLAESLRLLRGLAPDLVISSAAPSGRGYEEMAPEDWPAKVDAALERLLAAA